MFNAKTFMLVNTAAIIGAEESERTNIKKSGFNAPATDTSDQSFFTTVQVNLFSRKTWKQTERADLTFWSVASYVQPSPTQRKSHKFLTHQLYGIHVFPRLLAADRYWQKVEPSISAATPAQMLQNFRSCSVQLASRSFTF